MPDYLLLALFPFGVIFAGIADLLTYAIPNRASLILAGAFLLASAVLVIPVDAILSCVVAGLLVFLIGFALFARGWIGGGDAKLLAAAALWIGLEHLLPFLFWTALLGGGLSIILLTYRRILPPLWLLGQSWAMRLHDPKEGIPYGVAIAGAALIVYPSTGWMTGFAG